MTYLELVDDVNLQNMQAKFPDFLLKHMPPDEGDTDNVNNYYKLYIKSLSDVHLASIDVEHDYHNYRKFNGSYINIFKIAAIFILLIACVNFMNLTTARASYRWKEVGIRKSIGASYQQLFRQFILESIVLAFIAMILSLLIAIVATPKLNEAIGRSMTISLLFSNWIVDDRTDHTSDGLGFAVRNLSVIYLDIRKTLSDSQRRNDQKWKKYIPKFSGCIAIWVSDQHDYLHVGGASANKLHQFQRFGI